MKNVIIVLAAFLLSVSCSKKDSEPTNQKGKLEFSLALGSNSKLKSAIAEPSASFILITIQDSEGKEVYNSEKIEIFKFGQNYISNPISLAPGNYSLTKFFVLDIAGNIIYATPLKDSPKAYLVKNPLSISFNIQADVVTKLTPEVLSTETITPSDFGYAEASFQVVKTFNFLTSVFVYNETTQILELTNASVSISAEGNDLYTLPLEAKTNMVTVNDGFANYTLKVKKAGYETFIATFTTDSLKGKFDSPLIVTLQKSTADILTGLVAYYPFNGNVNDESGNAKDGVNFGAGNYINTVKGVAKGFENSNLSNAQNYFTIPNSIGESYTISMRFMVNSLTHYNTLLYLSAGKDWVHSDFWLAVDPNKKITIIQGGQDLRSEDYSHAALVNNSLNQVYLSNPDLQSGVEYNLAMTFSNNIVNVYINGAKYATYTNVLAITPTTNTLLVGACPNYVTELYYYPLNGYIDELRFYNSALSEASLVMLAE